MIAAVGHERVGVKFSPNIPFNDVEETDADALYPYILEWLNTRNIAYVHVADSTGKVHAKLRAVYHGIYFAGAGFSKESGEELVTQGGADAIVFGTKLLANPDLPERFRHNASLMNRINRRSTCRVSTVIPITRRWWRPKPLRESWALGEVTS